MEAQPHRFANAGSETVRLLLTMTPYQLQFLQAVSQLAPAGPPDPDKLRELMARYDTELGITRFACGVRYACRLSPRPRLQGAVWGPPTPRKTV